MVGEVHAANGQSALRELSLRDLRAALAEGWADFRACPAHGLFFGAIYVIAGLLLSHALAQLQFIQAGAQHAPGLIAVAVLGPVVLTLHHYARWNMSEAHRRVSFVDVLTASTGSAIGVSADISGIDLNLDRVINFGIDINTGK